MFDEMALRRFWEKVEVRGPDQCWPWLGAMDRPKPSAISGYGHIRINGVTYRAHRLSVLVSGRELPSGQVVDHLCRNPICVNPKHLEVVSNRENVLRGVGPTAVNAQKTHCYRGHELTPDNVMSAYYWRQCRTCKLKDNRAYKERRRHG